MAVQILIAHKKALVKTLLKAIQAGPFQGF